MNEQEKSLKLAELMGWEVEKHIYSDLSITTCIRGTDEELCPYEYEDGLAQFAAILLEFIEVMYSHAIVNTLTYAEGCYEFAWNNDEQPTQAKILDEILRMKGVDIG